MWRYLAGLEAVASGVVHCVGVGLGPAEAVGPRVAGAIQPRRASVRQLQPPPNAEAPGCQPDRPHVFADDLLPTAAATAAGPYLHISLSTLGCPMIKLVTQWESLQGDPATSMTQTRPSGGSKARSRM